MEYIGLEFPILRQLIGFIYLTLVPGVLILRILKLHKLSNIETLLYSVGLSVSVLMFIGLFINIVYPNLFGLSNPISAVPLIVTISIVTAVLCITCYLSDEGNSDFDLIDIGEILSLPVLFLSLIPIFTIIGTYLVNFHHNNILLMLVIFLIAIVGLLIGFDKFIPPKLYPFTIWILSISLIWHRTLVSQYINVCDIVGEYYFADLVIKNSFWDWTLVGNYNSVLSIVMLAPIYNQICNLDLTWVFKIIFPSLYSLVPLGVFSVFLNETKNSKVAFLSSFLFISIAPFYGEVAIITKQSTAELFFVILLLLILNKTMSKAKRSTLLIIFADSLIVSHYGTSYLFMISLLFVLFFLYFTEPQNKLRKIFHFKLKKEDLISNNFNIINKYVSINFILLYVIFAILWYMYISNSSTFINAVLIGKFAVNSIFSEYFNPEDSRGLYTIMRGEVSTLWFITKIFYLITQFFILVGLVKTLFNYKRTNFSKVYLGFSLYYLLLLIASLIHSSFSVMDPRRLYQLSLFTLAPFSIMGSLIACRITYVSFNLLWTTKCETNSLKLVSVFLTIFLLLNTGFIFEISNDHVSSNSLSQESFRITNNFDDKARFYGSTIFTQNVFSGKWLGTNMNKNQTVYRGDVVQGFPSLTIYGNIDPKNILGFSNKSTNIDPGYVQLSYANIVGNFGSIWFNDLQIREYYNFSDLYPLIDIKNRIYDNGGSEILLD
ncbi:MAG: DUF2206 domain-containing protein [Methanosarcina sp.]|nr:DUF2206 domain-containing protein [Methanosarcina sp.]